MIQTVKSLAELYDVDETAWLLAGVYREAVNDAVDETGSPKASFPPECPWTVETLLAEDLLDE
jgi:uncharacterized protein DUF29